MMLQKLSIETKLLILSLLILAGLITWIYILQGQKAELELQNAGFKERAEKVEQNLKTLREENKELNKGVEKLAQEKADLILLLEQIPTDDESITEANITLLDANASWAEIKLSIDEVIADTTAWE